MAENPVALRETIWRDLDPYAIAMYLNAILDGAGFGAFVVALGDIVGQKGLSLPTDYDSMPSGVEGDAIAAVLRACHLRLTVTPR